MTISRKQFSAADNSAVIAALILPATQSLDAPLLHFRCPALGRHGKLNFSPLGANHMTYPSKPKDAISWIATYVPPVLIVFAFITRFFPLWILVFFAFLIAAQLIFFWVYPPE